MASFAEAFCEVFAHALWHKEFRVLGPPVAALGQLDLFFTERFTMSGGTIFLMRGAIANVAVHNDEGRSVDGLFECAESPLQHVQVVGIAYALDIPAV